MNKTISIKTVWYGLVFLLTLMPIAILFPWIAIKTHSFLLENALQKEAAFNERIRDHLNSEILRFITLLENKSEPVLYTLTQSVDRNLLSSLLKKVVSREPSVHSLYLIKPNGELYLGIKKLREKSSASIEHHYETINSISKFNPGNPEIVIPMHGRVYISSPTNNEGELNFFVAVPVGLPENPVAVLLAEVNAEEFWHGIASVLSRPGVVTYLIDSRGSLLTVPDETKKYAVGEILTKFSVVRALIAKKQLTQTDDYIGITGIPVFGTVTNIDALNWGVISEIPEGLIKKPIYDMLTGMAVVFFMTMLLFGGGGLLFVRRIATSFKDISSAFEYVRDGDYSKSLPHYSIADFDLLSSGFNRMIDDIKKREKDLRYSEEKTRSIVASLGEGIVSIGTDRIIRFVNQELCNILGYSEKELIGQDAQIMIPENYRSRHVEGMKRYLKEGKSNILGQRMELEGIRKDGTIFPLEIRVEETGMKKHGDVFFTAAIRDITEHKKAVKEIEHQKTMFESIFNGVGDAIVLTDTQRKIVTINPAFTKILGYNLQDILGKETEVFYESREVYKKTGEERYNLRAKEKLKPYVVNYQRKDGTVFPGETVGATIRSKSGKIVGFLGVIRDVTERKRLEQVEIRFGRILETSLNEIYIFDAETLRFIQVNRGALKNIGYLMDELKELTPLDIKPEFTPEAFEEIIQPLRNGDKEIIQFITVHRRKDESLYPVEVHLQLFSGESSPVFVGIILDITKRKQDEEKLRKLSQAVEQTPASVIITDREGNIEYVNPKFCEITGYSSEEVLGQNPRFLKSDEKSPEDYKELWDTIKSGKEWRGEFHNKKKNGELFWEQARLSPIKTPDGEITHFLSVKEDITEKKKADKKLEEKESQLRQSQKMEAIGTLAGGIAHDFNNILTAILGYTELSMDSLTQEGDLTNNLQQIHKAGERARDLVSQILMFSRQSKKELLAVQLHLILKEAIKLMRASIPSNIEINEDISIKDDLVNADPTQIHQIIMNLCTNASHAMEGKNGVLGIILEPFDVDKDFAKSQTNIEEGKYVRLSVSDTGHGIDETSIEKIFDPFFTTKKKGEGTGLGLSVVYGIVQQMGGTITVHSELKNGTTFRVYFPLAKKEKTLETPVVSNVQGGSETILFVDDEEMIVDMGKKALQGLGYQVISTTDSLEALETFKTLHEKIDLVITDQTMPNMTGDELARKFLSLRPDIPIILCTGFSQIITEEKAKKIGIREFLKKPLIIKDLAVLIRQVLDQK